MRGVGCERRVECVRKVLEFEPRPRKAGDKRTRSSLHTNDAVQGSRIIIPTQLAVCRTLRCFIVVLATLLYQMMFTKQTLRHKLHVVFTLAPLPS